MVNVLVFIVYLHKNSCLSLGSNLLGRRQIVVQFAMDLKVLKDAEFLMKSEMAVVAGGAMSGCSSCCDKENGGTNQQQQELEKGDKSHD